MDHADTEIRIIEVTLANGATLLVRAVDLDDGPAAKASLEDIFAFDGISATLEGIGDAIQSALARVRPNKATAQFGLELCLKSGRLTGLLVDGAGKASISVTLEWQGDGRTKS